MAVTLV